MSYPRPLGLCRNSLGALRQAAMWMSTTLSKERLAAIRGTAHGRHTDLNTSLFGRARKPGISVSRCETSGVFPPGTACRRVVPWGNLSSLVEELYTVRPNIHHTSKSQGERLSSCFRTAAIPFVVSLSNHERNCDTVSLGEERVRTSSRTAFSKERAKDTNFGKEKLTNLFSYLR